MKFIKEKKIHPYLMIFFMYLSFCMANWYMSRGVVAGFGDMLSGAAAKFLANDIVAFLIGGIVPILAYEAVTWFVFRFAQSRLGGAVDDMRYALRFFFIPANVIIFLIKLLYFAFPLMLGYGNLFIDFIVATGFAVWYLFYAAKNFVEKDRIGMMLYQLGGAYLIVNVIIHVFNILMGVFL